MSDPRDYLARSTVVREDRQRRAVLFATGVLILLATSPVLAHHIGSQFDELLAGRDHLWRICVIAAHQLLAPVHETFHALLLVGLAYATWDRVRIFLTVRRLLAAVHVASPTRGDSFWTAAQESGVPLHLLRIVEGLPNPAFTVGWIRPRIFLAAALASAVSQEELRAVLAHEYAHVRRRDPARLSIMRFVGYSLFWLPALRRLAADAADDAEIAADDMAVQESPVVLASAILKLAHWRVTDDKSGAVSALFSREDGMVGLNRDALLDRRIRRLVGEEAPVVSHVNRRSVAVALFALLLVWTSGAAVAHPLPDEQALASGHEAHCSHRGSAIAHLFCLGGRAHVAGAPCPHASSKPSSSHGS